MHSYTLRALYEQIGENYFTGKTFITATVHDTLHYDILYFKIKNIIYLDKVSKDQTIYFAVNSQYCIYRVKSVFTRWNLHGRI